MRFERDRSTDAPEPPQAERQAVGCGRCGQSVPLHESALVIWPDGDDMWVCLRCVAVVATFHDDAVISGTFGAEGDG